MIVEKKGFILLNVHAVPRASRSEIVGEHDGALKVRIASPPVDGAANDELVRLLAKTCRVPKADIAIVSGQASKTKLLRINGVTAAELRSLLAL